MEGWVKVKRGLRSIGLEDLRECHIELEGELLRVIEIVDISDNEWFYNNEVDRKYRCKLSTHEDIWFFDKEVKYMTDLEKNVKEELGEI